MKVKVSRRDWKKLVALQKKANASLRAQREQARETGVKMEDGQQMYHAYIRDPYMGLELLASGPKEWVTQKAYDWLTVFDHDPESEVFIARIEEKLDVEEFIAKGEQ